MRLRTLYGVLILAFIALTGVLLLEKEVDCVIVSMPKIYSIYHSDQLETIDIEVLTNQPQHYYFDEEYITQIKINNEDQTFPVEVHSIQIKTVHYEYLNQEFQSITFHVRPELTSTDLWVAIEDASLTITYDNGRTISIQIGEFNYLFMEDIRSDLSLNQLSATYEEIDGVNSVGGINIGIRNRRDELIQITSIDLVATGVITNESMYLKREECSYTTPARDCLYLESYSFSVVPKPTELRETVLAGQLFEAYIPLSYISYPFIHQFAIEITYHFHQQEYLFIIDDFPYMKTANFQTAYEEWYIVYFPDDPN